MTLLIGRMTECAAEDVLIKIDQHEQIVSRGRFERSYPLLVHK